MVQHSKKSTRSVCARPISCIAPWARVFRAKEGRRVGRRGSCGGGCYSETDPNRTADDERRFDRIVQRRVAFRGQGSAEHLPPLLALLLVLCAGPAWGDKWIVSDLFGEPDVRGQAIGLTIVVRQVLSEAKGELIERNALATAIRQITGRPARYALIVPREHEHELLQRLSASKLFYGVVRREGSSLTVAIGVRGAGGRKGLLSLTVPHGGWPAVQVANRLRQALSIETTKPAPIPDFRQLLPFVRAEIQMLAQARGPAAYALRVADGSVGRRLSTARQFAEQIVADRTAPAEDRVITAVVAGSFDKASEIARQALARAVSKEQRAAARGLSALIAVGEGKPKAAQRLLRGLQSDTAPVVGLARARLLNQQGRRNARDRLLQRLIEQYRYLPAVAEVARLEDAVPNVKLLRLAFRRLRDVGLLNYPDLANALALKLMVHPQRQESEQSELMGFLRLEFLSKSEMIRAEPIINEAAAAGVPGAGRLKAELALHAGQTGKAKQALLKALEQGPDGRGHRLLARVFTAEGDHRRAAEQFALAAKDKSVGSQIEYARALERSGKRAEAQAVYRQLDKDPDTASALASLAKLRVMDSDEAAAGVSTNASDQEMTQMFQLVAELDRFLKAFAPLVAGRLARVAVVGVTSNASSAIALFRSHPERLAQGLRLGLQRLPQVQRVRVSTQQVGRLSKTELSRICREEAVDAVLVYALSPSGLRSARLDLVLFDRGQQQALEFGDKVRGHDLGIISFNPVPPAIFGVLLLSLVVWRVVLLIRGTGELKIKLVLDPATERHAFSIVVNRSKDPPPIKDLNLFMRRMKDRGAKSSRMSATMVRSFCRLPHVRVGKYFVHLVGGQYKAGELIKLPPTLSQHVRVTKGKTADLVFDLEPKRCDLRVSVFDGDTPVARARVWLDQNVAQAKHTDSRGQVKLQVVRHRRTKVHIKVGETEVQRTVQFDDTRGHSLSINLAKERRLSEFADGISLQSSEMGEVQGPIAGGKEFDATAFSQSSGAGTQAFGVGMSPDIELSASAAGPALTTTPTPTPAPDSNNRSGMQRYQRVAELGRGAMGVVYKAQDLVLEREVALKVIGEELRSHPQVLQMFIQEAKALAALNHPNVVTVFDQGQDAEVTYLVMEFVEGRTLESMIEAGGALSIDHGLILGDQLCSGLSYAHGRQIIHRDIKPENVFVTSEGRVKIGDFGLARVMRELSIRKTTIKGTPLYMAPEQIRGTDIDFRADIYSVGCTLYSVFTGRPPFVEGEILYHHLHSEPPPPSSLSPGLPTSLDEVLLRCVAKDKQQRYESAEALRQALGRLRAAAA